MWFHPWNLNTDTSAMFSGLEDAFSYARRMREKGLLDILTMGEYAQRLQRDKCSVVQMRGGSTLYGEKNCVDAS